MPTGFAMTEDKEDKKRPAELKPNQSALSRHLESLREERRGPKPDDPKTKPSNGKT